MYVKCIAVLLLLCFVASAYSPSDKPRCCGSNGWGSTNWGGDTQYTDDMHTQALGMRTPVGGGITEYYIPNVGWVSYDRIY